MPSTICEIMMMLSCNWFAKNPKLTKKWLKNHVCGSFVETVPATTSTERSKLGFGFPAQCRTANNAEHFLLHLRRNNNSIEGTITWFCLHYPKGWMWWLWNEPRSQHCPMSLRRHQILRSSKFYERQFVIWLFEFTSDFWRFWGKMLKNRGNSHKINHIFSIFRFTIDLRNDLLS